MCWWDIVALKDGLPEKTLKRDDFELYDNGSRVSITTFDTGAESATRPLALWLVVQCRMPGWDAQGSGLFAGQMDRFEPVLRHIDPRDAVGVAHWCDNGDSLIDLQPTGNVDAVAPAVERVLSTTPKPKYQDEPENSRCNGLCSGLWMLPGQRSPNRYRS